MELPDLWGDDMPVPVASLAPPDAVEASAPPPNEPEIPEIPKLQEVERLHPLTLLRYVPIIINEMNN